MSNREQILSTGIGALVGFVATGFNPVGALAGRKSDLLVAAELFPPDSKGADPAHEPDPVPPAAV